MNPALSLRASILEHPFEQRLNIGEMLAIMVNQKPDELFAAGIECDPVIWLFFTRVVGLDADSGSDLVLNEPGKSFLPFHPDHVFIISLQQSLFQVPSHVSHSFGIMICKGRVDAAHARYGTLAAAAALKAASGGGLP